MKFILSTSVWGNDYIDNFINFTVPSLLAYKNIPYLSKKININYYIYTEKKLINKIKNSPYIKKLKKFSNIFYNTKIIDQNLNLNKNNNQINNYRYHLNNLCHSNAINIANKANCPWIWIHPDNIYSNNCFQTIYNLYKEDYRVVFAPGGIRTYANETKKKISSKFKKNNVINIKSNDLVKISLKNIVNKHKSHIYNNFHNTNKFQYEVIWPINNHGAITKITCGANPIFFFPEIKKKYFFEDVSIECSDYLDKCIINKNKIFFLENSYDFFTCSLENNFKKDKDKIEFYKTKKTNNLLHKPSALALALSALDYNKTKMCNHLFLKNIKYREDLNTRKNNIIWQKHELLTKKINKQVYNYINFFEKRSYLLFILKILTFIHLFLIKFINKTYNNLRKIH